MNNKLAKASIAGVAAIALAASGSTFASWYDMTSIEDNAAGAGVLKLNLKGKNTDSASLGFDNIRLVPGKSGDGGKGAYYDRVVYVTSSDGKSVPDGDLTLSLMNFEAPEGDSDATGLGDGSLCTTNSEKVAEAALGHLDVNGEGNCGTAGEFDDQSKFEIRYSEPVVLAGDKATANCDNDSNVNMTHNESVATSTLAGGRTWDLGTVAPGEGVCAIITIRLPQNADNASQGDSVSFDMEYRLDQHFN